MQLEKAKATLDLLPAQHGYKNALEVTKAMKTAKAELQEVRKKQKVWDQEEVESAERLYLTIPANVQRVERQEEIKSSGQKQSLHERLEEKKQMVNQQTKKKKQRNEIER